MSEFELHNEEALTALRELDFNRVSSFIVSPPYLGQRGETDIQYHYENCMAHIYKEAAYKLTKDGTISTVVRFKRDEENWFDMDVFSTWQQIYYRAGLNMLNLLIWVKSNPVPVGDLYNKPLDIPAHEYIFVGTKSNSPREAKARCGQRQYSEKTIAKAASGNMRGNGRYSNGHSNVAKTAMGFDYIIAATADGKNRPVAEGGSFSMGLARELIYRFSDEGDTVGDFFAGVCTTGKAALEMGRNFWGCDRHDVDLQKGHDWLNDAEQMRLL